MGMYIRFPAENRARFCIIICMCRSSFFFFICSLSIAFIPITHTSFCWCRLPVLTPVETLLFVFIVCASIYIIIMNKLISVKQCRGAFYHHLFFWLVIFSTPFVLSLTTDVWQFCFCRRIHAVKLLCWNTVEITTDVGQICSRVPKRGNRKKTALAKSQRVCRLILFWKIRSFFQFDGVK